MNEKQKRQKLRELAGQAWEEELRQALTPLAEAFERWKARAASSFEISDLIHEIHQGPSRTIWSGRARVMDLPPSATSPEAARTTPEMAAKSVVFPDPFPPRRATTSFSATWMVAARKAWILP
jgi:hypothetical protein